MYRILVNRFLSQSALSVLRDHLNVQRTHKVLKLCRIRLVHTTTISNGKLHVDKENRYIYGLLPPNQEFNTITSDIEKCLEQETDVDMEEFEAISKKSWKACTVNEIVRTFGRLVNFCNKHNINLSDRKFDALIDGLLNNVEHLTYNDIVKLLDYITQYPVTESVTSHNFEDLWQSLDDVCYWRMNKWTIDQRFAIAEFWYRLNLGRKGNYVFKLVEMYVKKASRLTKEQLLRVFFFLNVCRKNKVDFEYENALNQYIDDLTLNEMAIVALGFFKTKSKIRSMYVLRRIMEAIKSNASDVDHVTLTSLLKILRFSGQYEIADEFYPLIDALTPEIPRLSTLCCLHLAIVGTALQVVHSTSLKLIARKICANISDIEIVRLKDIERLLLALTMGNVSVTEPDVYSVIVDELRKPSRLAEIGTYPRPFVCALHYLTINGTYALDLIAKALDSDFVKLAYGKANYIASRELFSLDMCVGIERAESYEGDRLSMASRYKRAKFHTETPPDPLDARKRLTAAEKLIVDVMCTVRELVGDERLCHVAHILPHFSKADIILCKNRRTGEFVEPTGFANYIVGDVMRPHDSEIYQWYAVVIMGINLTVWGTSIPVGSMSMKLRQLEMIGYKPVTVVWKEFLGLSRNAKRQYIRDKIDEVSLQREMQEANY